MKINLHLRHFDHTGTQVYIPQQKYRLDLSLTENPLKYSPHVIEAISDHLHKINHYPDPNYTELTHYLSQLYRLTPDHFIFGAGVDGLIENLIRSLINPHDQVVMPALSFLNTSFAATIAGAQVSYGRMTNSFRIDFDDLHQRINSHTKMVFICNPNNPTGLVETTHDLLNIVSNTHATVVVDEANIDFAGESLITSISKYPNLVILRTFSKGYGLAGLRIGYCVGNPELMRYIWRVRPPFATTNLSQVAALAALKDPQHISRSANYIAKERTFLTQELKRRGFVVIPSQANCFLVKVTPLFTSSTAFNDLLHQHDCTVVDGIHFRGLGSDYIRVAPQLHDTNQRFLEIIDLIIKYQ